MARKMAKPTIKKALNLNVVALETLKLSSHTVQPELFRDEYLRIQDTVYCYQIR